MKKEKGIRNIKIKGKNVKFKRGARFKHTKTEAEITQVAFQERGHLTRIFPARIPIKHKEKIIGTTKGYYVWSSEHLIRKRRVRRKPKKTVRKIKDFSVGRGKDKVSIKNIKRINREGIGIYYESDVYERNKLTYQKLPISVKNSKQLQNFFRKSYPKGMKGR